ncbi:MAG: bifunctional methylenetetrahydrofolate dehydrogenase/methenyltetrahydrofolate cyclohydrolase FolD [Rhodospirillaceae bacterium]|jgi:methylenetetrahydrofolate dehydrogenase (NADP+)/methenyltetrahydrofolate cyclohydrolase|nr:bifunctional methylenetetrahydrofolate dehydrogenase/methenyltetrahydrofolate cyclohydrolase FolD [Rhodospirillaceae bacterium]
MNQAKIIDGNIFASYIRNIITNQIVDLKAGGGPIPGLAVILVGDNSASHIYVKNKNKRATEVGIISFEYYLQVNADEKELLSLIKQLNVDPRVHGILVQLPLPKQIDAQKVIEAIDPDKDVDGFHPLNVGRLTSGSGTAIVPCTPLGCLLLAKSELVDLSGKISIVLGRSNIVGKPMAQLLLRESATVIIAHSHTRNLPDVCRKADILIAAVGQPKLIKGDWIKPGALVLDVGINRILSDTGKSYIVGDVAFNEALSVAGAITPVPGGIGPITIAILLRNVLEACCRIHDLPFKEVI